MPSPIDRPIKVLLWSPKGAGQHYGGPGTAAYRLYSKADQGRFRLTLAHGYSDQEDYPLFEKQQLIRVLSPINPWTQLRFVRLGAKWIKTNARNFDVFHGLQGFEMTVTPALQAQRLGLPAVVKLAAYRSDLADKDGLRNLLGLPRRRRARIQQLSGIIAISQLVAQELLEYGIPESKIARIPNGVDVERFYPVDRQQRRALRDALGWGDFPTVLFVGGITPRKSPLVLVETLRLLHKRNLDCQLVFVGPEHDHSYTAMIKTRIKELSSGRHVKWVGFTTDIARMYQAADIYALPSSSEGMPNALLEAMACGLACIGTPISGTNDLITDGVNGRLVAADPSEMVIAIDDYLSSAELPKQHGRAARQTILDRYSAQAVLAAHEALFRRIMSGAVAAAN
ncbi:MAG: glycosyltransferase family 4 protein [Gammaproteobacteria bacterium]